MYLFLLFRLIILIIACNALIYKTIIYSIKKYFLYKKETINIDSKNLIPSRRPRTFRFPFFPMMNSDQPTEQKDHSCGAGHDSSSLRPYVPSPSDNWRFVEDQTLVEQMAAMNIGGGDPDSVGERLTELRMTQTDAASLPAPPSWTLGNPRRGALFDANLLPVTLQPAARATAAAEQASILRLMRTL